MRFLQLIALATLVYGSSALAADEAVLYQQVRQLQAVPDVTQRPWLEDLLDYRSSDMIDLGESREPMLVPNYPIANAARAALLVLDVEALKQEFAHTEPSLPVTWDSRAQQRAWAEWIAQSAQLPSVVSNTGPAYAWPEMVLRAIAQHPQATSRWTLALLNTAVEGASLRWIDSILPTLAFTTLKTAAGNPAIAETIGVEWGRRANAQSAEAIAHLRNTAINAPDTPGLAAALAVWEGTPALLSSMQKTGDGPALQSDLMAAVARYRKYLPHSAELQP